MTLSRVVSTCCRQRKKNELNMYFEYVMDNCEHVKKRMNTITTQEDMKAYMYQVYITIQKEDGYFVSKSNEFAYKN